MIEQIQDEDLAKRDLADHERMVAARAPYESMYNDIDALFPDGAGGFSKTGPGQLRGQNLFDGTHIIANTRFAAAGVGITTPEESGYIRPRFLDPDLNKLPRVRQWCWNAGQRLYGIRHALHTGFITAANEDWDQLGRYGTSPMWADMLPNGRGMFYRCLHLSACWIDVDFSGLVNRVHFVMEKRVDQLEDMFGREALTEKMVKALEDKKPHTLFQVLHLVAPAGDWDSEAFDWRRFPIASRYLAMDEKIYLRRKGFHSMPVSVSRHMTAPSEIYGRSPAIRLHPSIAGVQSMRKTTLRTAHKAADPALAFNNDDGVNKIVTKPGGLNPGLVDENGRLLVARMPGGEGGLPWAQNELENERALIRTEFFEEFYKILTDPNSRMTQLEVMQVMAKQGVLVRPFASRYATEKQHPISQREIDLALREGQIEPLPPEVLEAGAWPVIEYENQLAEMARAESTNKTLRFVEFAGAVATLEQSPVADSVDTDAMLRGGAAEIGINPEYLFPPEVAKANREKRAEAEAGPMDAEALGAASGAVLDLAKANQIGAAA